MTTMTTKTQRKAKTAMTEPPRKRKEELNAESNIPALHSFNAFLTVVGIPPARFFVYL